MTTVEEMWDNAIGTLSYLNRSLPAKSHVILVGLGYGGEIYEVMQNRLHPLGTVHGDVTYKDFYEYIKCLQVTPCYGWLNENATVREETQKRADELSNVLRDIAQKKSFQNFKLHYMRNPMKQSEYLP